MTEHKEISWQCFSCAAEEALTTHWLTSLGCVHYDNERGDNAASCWCGWNGPRVPNVGEAVRTWAEHTADALAAAMRAASGMEARQGGNEVPSRSDDSPAPQGDAHTEGDR
jgi:hypothetical protein